MVRKLSPQYFKLKFSLHLAQHNLKHTGLQHPARLLIHAQISLQHTQTFTTLRTPRPYQTYAKMKLNITSSAVALLRLSTLASAASTAPASAASNTTSPEQPIITPTTGHVDLGEEVPPGRQREEQADQYLFDITLDSFMSHRDQRYPSYFWWESDGCSQSPDAPFGFPFLPACYRHDFGYDQYKQVCASSTLRLLSISLISYLEIYFLYTATPTILPS